MELDKNYQGGKYLPVPYKSQNIMWIKTGYLTDFIESGGIDLPNHLSSYVLNDSKQGGYNKQTNYCPFCDNPHKKYTLFKCYPAHLGGKKVEFYVCKDCRSVIVNEDPMILEIVEQQIKENFHETTLPDNYTPQQWHEKKKKDKKEEKKNKFRASTKDNFKEDDYFKHQTLSVYLRDFLSTGNFPDHVLDYSFDKRNKCIWCDTTKNLDEVDFPITTQFKLIIGRVFMCNSCERHYYDILDRKLIPNLFVSEICVNCKGYHYVSSNIHGDRIIKNELDSHHCNTCLSEAGLETYPYSVQVKCKGCDVVVMENYDLTLNGKMIDEIYCYKCSENYGTELAEQEATYNKKLAKSIANKVQTQEGKNLKEDLFGGVPGKESIMKRKSYSRRLYNKKFHIYVVIMFICSYPANKQYCYFNIEEGLSEEDQSILEKEIAFLESEDGKNYTRPTREELLKGMSHEEYGFVTNLYSSYEDDDLLFALHKTPEDNVLEILKCVDAAHKKASSIVYEYERLIRLPL